MYKANSGVFPPANVCFNVDKYYSVNKRTMCNHKTSKSALYWETNERIGNKCFIKTKIVKENISFLLS